MISNHGMCRMIVLLILVSVPVSPAYTETEPPMPDNVVMVTGVDKHTHFLGRWLWLVYDDAFSRLGITLVYKKYPWKRCGLLADYGEVDGDLWRSPSYHEKHPNLVRVEEEGPFSYFCAWAVRPEIVNLNGWTDLKGTYFKVDYVRGTKVSESQLPLVVSPDKLTAVNKVENGFGS